MEFKKYSEIENSYQQKYINIVVDQGQAGGEWCVTEKVHGSNYGIFANSDEFRGAKRTDFLQITDSFFNHQQILKKYGKRIQEQVYPKVIKWASEFDADYVVKNIVVYGELFGGTYPHPDIKHIPEQQTVQRGVYYSPLNEFYAFDIRVAVVKSGDEETKHVWVPYNTAYAILTEAELLVAKPLLIGTYTECLAYNNQFITTLPGIFGLPEIENNWCEGVVIKPWDSAKHLRNGERIIIKNKNNHYKEKVQKGGKLNALPKLPTELSEAEVAARELIAEFVCDNRLHNVLSKIGEVNQEDFSKVMKAMVEDVKGDFVKEYDMAEYGKYFGKFTGMLCADLIRKNFIDIVNGQY
jgi:Rnl2 family RNA ligase